MVITGFRGDIAEDHASRAAASRDASLFKVMPQAVVFPRDADDVRALVAFANANRHLGISLTARAAGTDMTGGPLSESVVVDFTRYMNRVREVGYGFAVAEPGTYYRDLERALAAKDFLLPSYPASKGLCAIGGMVANNSGGEKTLSYGKTADYVAQVDMACSDGNVYSFGTLDARGLKEKMRLATFEGGLYRSVYDLVTGNADIIRAAKPEVSKNSAGYALWDVYDGTTFDMARLVTGSQGTLGLMTEVRLRTIRPKKHSRLLVMFVNDASTLAALVPKVLEHRPESFESYDDHTLKLGMRYMFFRFAWQFVPEVMMILRNGGLPKLVLLAEFTGDSERETLAKAEAARKGLGGLCGAMRVTKTARDAEKYWAVRRESFNLLRTKLHGRQTAPFIDDVIVSPEKLPQFLPELEALMKPYEGDMTYTVAGHMGNGNFHIIPLMDLKSARSRQVIVELAEKVYALVVRYGGSITAEHNDGLMRTPYLEQMYGERICALFREVKRIFDPHGIFNPGKKVGGSAEYARAHIRRE